MSTLILILYFTKTFFIGAVEKSSSCVFKLMIFFYNKKKQSQKLVASLFENISTSPYL